MVLDTSHEPHLVVARVRRFGPDPKLGRLHVYVDGRPRGAVPMNHQRLLALSTGTHTVRVRHWWFMSPSCTVEVGPRAEIRLEADVPPDGTLVQRIARAIFRPLHRLTLTSDTE
jgi:hypothetical protein